MKKTSLIIWLALAILIAIVANYHSRKHNPPDANVSLTANASHRTRSENDANSFRGMRPDHGPTRWTTNLKNERNETPQSRRGLHAASARREEIRSPLGRDIASSTINAELAPGETLVTGGYKTADGNYELTLLTPSMVTLEDGREAFEIDAKVLSVGSEFVEAHGLETLVTNATNTLQHAEAWMQDEISKTLTAARNAEGLGILSCPKVVTLPSSPFRIGIVETHDAEFSIEGAVARNPNGSFTIESRVQRTPKAEE